MIPDGLASASPANLRHALRTPLNHIIGYSEMMLDELADAEGTSPDASTELNAIVFNARELARFIQNALPQGKSEVSDSDVGDLRLWLRPHLLDLVGHIGALEATANHTNSGDIARVRSAAERLLAFTHGDAAALGEPAVANHPIVFGDPAPGGKGRVLVVDDSPVNRDLLRRMLERDGYSTCLAEGGEAALTALRDSTFDLILLDVLMPGTSGFDVLTSLQASGSHKGAPVIMISALDEGSSVIRCMHMGSEDYFIKPFDPVLLRTRIEIALDRRRLRALVARASEAVSRLAEETSGNVAARLAELADELRKG